MKHSLSFAFALSIPASLVMGLGFGMFAAFLAPSVIFPVFLVGTFFSLTLLTPVLYVARSRQVRTVASLLQEVQKQYHVIRWETANLFTYGKIRATGCLFLTEEFLLFLTTEKRRDLYNFSISIEKMAAAIVMPEKKGELKLYFRMDDSEIRLLTFSLPNPGYWEAQLSARIQARDHQNDSEKQE